MRLSLCQRTLHDYSSIHSGAPLLSVISVAFFVGVYKALFSLLECAAYGSVLTYRLVSSITM